MMGMGSRKVLFVFLLAAACAKPAPPDPAKEHRALAGVAMGKADWKTAIAEFDLSLQANPKQDKEVWEQKAYAHFQLSQWDQFDDATARMAEMQPDQKAKADVYRGAAAQYLERQVPERAERAFLKVLEVDPKDYNSMAWVAEINAQRGGARTKNPPDPVLLQKSFEYYDKAIAMSPEQPNTYINKRIALAKFSEWVTEQRDAAAAKAGTAKNKDEAQDAKAKAAQYQAQLDDIKKQYDALTEKFTEMQKAAKAKADAAQPTPTAGEPKK